MLLKKNWSKVAKLVIILLVTSLLFIFFFFKEETASKQEDSITVSEEDITDTVYNMNYLMDSIFDTPQNRGYLRMEDGFKSKPELVSQEPAETFEGDLLYCESFYDISTLLSLLNSKQVLSYSYENVTNDEVVSLVIFLAEEGFDLDEYSNIEGKLIIKMSIEDKVVTIYNFLGNLEIMGNTNIF